MENIVLIGFMGAGKTTIGHLLAQKLNTKQHDFDEILVEKIGMSIADYFERFGSESFREVETNVLQQSIQLEGIISTGGGIVLKEENRLFLQENTNVIYLKADLDELIHRVVLDKRNVRPLATSKSHDEIREVYLPRLPLYEESAKYVIDTTKKQPEEIVQEILDKVEVM
ncbi:shikimate kinase [Tetragenococcus osmophilus]|uniref:Shikimate kinase n=1 Tax=Tetragenococcus osmophilus TaxID=526944 RepID=A0AA37XKI1_9ENTE|nr:shikimate kinase [Tetragenococcus osmophilus]AYW48593.1 shikimate kinase [Tetragenococcus osmophilus]GMA54507.1 shikimate kinase [Alicyclobacillus contaminans]GMA71644.1 shikimate kinase [Tetragenococcus osmophilus]